MSNVGYPVAEVASDGTFVVTKHAGTGGRVSRASVTEQLLYEIGDPGAYLTPDATVDFRSLDVTGLGADRVQVTGARGTPPPDSLKVTIVYRDGWRAVGLALLSGPDIRAKGQRLAEMVWERTGHAFADRRADLVGDRACWGPGAPDVEPNEGILRLAVRDPDRGAVERFSKMMMGLALQGPPGLGVFGGRPDVQPAYGYWPTLVPRALVEPHVEIRRPGRAPVTVAARPPVVPTADPRAAEAPSPGGAGTAASGPFERVPLRRLAFTRSGDKGAHANIGVAARSAAAFDALRTALPAARVAAFFGERVRGDVQRHELPGLRAFNFTLADALGGGGTLSLRADHQGKTLGQGLLGLEIDVPAAVVAATPADAEG
jgi:hypothetical protein